LKKSSKDGFKEFFTNDHCLKVLKEWTFTKRTITLHSLKIMESFDTRFTSQVDFNFIELLKNK
jgi:hypothetical protein